MTSTKEPNRVFRGSLAKQAKECFPIPPGSVSDCDCLPACNGMAAAAAAGVAAGLFEAARPELLEPPLAPLFDPPAPLLAPGKIALKLVVASESISPNIDCGCPCWKSRSEEHTSE